VQTDGVFVGTDSAVALMAESNWNPAAVRDAVSAGLSRLLSVDQAGIRWT
jgi:hypothetical protein